MAFNEALAERIRHGLVRKKGIEERKLFGGISFLLHGNMLVGVWKNSMIVRVGPDSYGEALLEPHAREFDITGKPMNGWLMVEPPGVEVDAQVKAWIQRAVCWQAANDGGGENCMLTAGATSVLLSTGSHLGDKPQFTGTLYFNMIGVREFFEQIKNKVEIVWPLEAMDYGQSEFGIRDPDGYTLAFAEAEFQQGLENWNTNMSSNPTINWPHEGRTVAVVGDVYRFLATGEDTSGKYALFEAFVEYTQRVRYRLIPGAW